MPFFFITAIIINYSFKHQIFSLLRMYLLATETFSWRRNRDQKIPKTEQRASLTWVFCRLRLQDRSGSNMIWSHTGRSHFKASVASSVALVFIYETCQNEQNSCKSAELSPWFLEKLKRLTSWKGSCRIWNTSLGINIKMLFYMMPTVSTCSNMNTSVCLHLADAFVQSTLQLFIHSYTDGDGCQARCRPADQEGNEPATFP